MGGRAGFWSGYFPIAGLGACCVTAAIESSRASQPGVRPLRTAGSGRPQPTARLQLYKAGASAERPADFRVGTLQHGAGPGIAFVGTVPAIKPACASSKSRRVSVLGTKGTVKREYTQALIRDFAQGCKVTLVGSRNLASLGEAALNGGGVSDQDILAEIAPCFVEDTEDSPVRTDTVVLACTHFPLLMDRLVALAPWPVDWIDPAPAIARRVANLLGPAGGATDYTGAEMIFTSGRPHRPSETLQRFFGGRVPV